MAKELERIIRDIDLLIKQGSGEKARSEIIKVIKDPVPRKQASEISQLSLRAGVPQLGIQLLRKYVRPTSKTPYVATDREKLEYGGCLAMLDATEESRQMLIKVDARKYPMALMYQVFALVSCWRYQKTIPLLRQFLKGDSISEYQMRVAKANLIAALVYENHHEEASKLIEELIPVLLENKLIFLYGNIMGLAAQNEIMQEKWLEAKRCLSEGEKALSGFGLLDSLFIEKWKAVLILLTDSNKNMGMKKLEQVRRKAIAVRHWETIRSCDMFEAVATQNESLLFFLFFGTPFLEFRNKLISYYPLDIRLPDSFNWFPGYRWNYHQEQNTKNIGLDISRLQIKDNNLPAKSGFLIHQTVLTLGTDFYRPFSIPVLFEKLYAGEFYDPVTSAQKVQQAIFRAKSWLRSRSLDLAIQCQKGEYSLISQGLCKVSVSRESCLLREEDIALEKIRSLWPNEAFTTKQVQKLLKISDRSVQKILQKGIQRKVLIKQGKARATQYWVKS